VLGGVEGVKGEGSMCPVVGLRGFWCQVGHRTLLHVIAFAGVCWLTYISVFVCWLMLVQIAWHVHSSCLVPSPSLENTPLSTPPSSPPPPILPPHPGAFCAILAVGEFMAV
jgi:hypothetical protein